MELSRDILVQKLKDLLDERISKDSLYAWTLGIFMKDECTETIARDEIVREALQLIIDYNREAGAAAPTKKDLEYIKNCLEGKVAFESLINRRKREKVQKKATVKKSYRKSVFLFLKLYVVLFAVSSIVVNLYGLMNPLFLGIRNSASNRWEILINTVPHFIYAIFLLFPIKFIVRIKHYYALTLLVFTVGTMYYWINTVSIAMQLTGNVLMTFVISPFTGIPTTIPLILILEARKEFLTQQRRANAVG